MMEEVGEGAETGEVGTSEVEEFVEEEERGETAPSEGIEQVSSGRKSPSTKKRRVIGVPGQSRCSELKEELVKRQLALLEIEHQAKMRVYEQQLRAACAMENYYCNFVNPTTNSFVPPTSFCSDSNAVTNLNASYSQLQ